MKDSNTFLRMAKDMFIVFCLTMFVAAVFAAPTYSTDNLSFEAPMLISLGIAAPTGALSIIFFILSKITEVMK